MQKKGILVSIEVEHKATGIFSMPIKVLNEGDRVLVAEFLARREEKEVLRHERAFVGSAPDSVT